MVKEKGTHTVMACICVCVFLSVAHHAVFYPQCLQMCPVGLQCRVAFGFRSALTEFVVCDIYKCTIWAQRCGCGFLLGFVLVAENVTNDTV